MNSLMPLALPRAGSGKKRVSGAAVSLCLAPVSGETYSGGAPVSGVADSDVAPVF